MIFKRKTIIKDDNFLKNRKIVIAGGNNECTIPVPDNVVLCNGCARNIYEIGDGYYIYLTKNDLKKNHPYDIYCEVCVNKYFPKAKEV